MNLHRLLAEGDRRKSRRDSQDLLASGVDDVDAKLKINQV